MYFDRQEFPLYCIVLLTAVFTERNECLTMFSSAQKQLFCRPLRRITRSVPRNYRLQTILRPQLRVTLNRRLSISIRWTQTDNQDCGKACTFVPHAICNSSDPIDKGFPTSSELLSEASASSTGCGLCIKRLITLRANGTDTVANELRRY